MATSRVMASSSSANSDLTRQSPIYSLDPSKNHGSMIMDDLIRNIYGGESDGGDGTPNIGGKSVDEVWKEISGSGARKIDIGDGSGYNGEITLEEYLNKEDIRVPAGFELDPSMSDRFGPQQQHQSQLPLENPILGFGNGAESGGGGRGKGRKRPVLDPVDSAALQRQKRMIKNRESAARSRERKQAYTVELESLVTQLEEEKAKLLREQEEQHRQRLKQLMENLIPVVERKKPARALRRTHSMQW